MEHVQVSFTQKKDPEGGGDATARCSCGWSISAGCSGNFQVVLDYVPEQMRLHIITAMED